MECEDKREEINSISEVGLFERSHNDDYRLRRIPIYCYSKNDYVRYWTDPAYRYANIIYYLDIDTPFYLDFYINSIIEDIPTEPTRENYKFIGWYMDVECTEEWDFETDKLDDFEYEYYYITKLYAKWEKIE